MGDDEEERLRELSGNPNLEYDESTEYEAGDVATTVILIVALIIIAAVMFGWLHN